MSSLSQIRDPGVTLAQYYLVRDDLLLGKIASYSIGDRNITLQDMTALEKIIRELESAVAGVVPVVANIQQPANMPNPGQPASWSGELLR
jgi:hypothetical protein